VTAELIQNSVRASSAHCMTAEAAKIAVPGTTKVSVDIHTIRFNDPKRPYRYIYITPRPVAEAILAFDQGITPDPFTCQLKGGTVIRQRLRPLHKKATRLERSLHAKDKRAHKAMNKARVVIRKKNTGDSPEVVGGHEPPMPKLRGPRAFGMKFWGRPSPQMMKILRASGQSVLDRTS
jgi:hypothetical protein